MHWLEFIAAAADNLFLLTFLFLLLKAFVPFLEFLAAILVE
jgi:hypothetical protein